MIVNKNQLNLLRGTVFMKPHKVTGHGDKDCLSVSLTVKRQCKEGCWVELDEFFSETLSTYGKLISVVKKRLPEFFDEALKVSELNECEMTL